MSEPGPQLPAGSPLQACPHCEALIDLTEREPLEQIECPGCGQEFAITGRIGPYQIIDIAGKGGMGVVYKAYDARLDRHIALKLLRKSHSEDAHFIEQLESEAAITASITHPNVVSVFGTGRDRGRFYLAMELVSKGSLDDLIQLQGRAAEIQILQVGIQIASGLRAAWEHGLIHRDVKPGNILFANANTAKIVDFGLAIFMEHEASSRGEVWGTPYYVAPEKLDQEPEDFRSDMYSLGATMFHALAGRPPFEAESASLVALKHLKSQAVSLQAFAPWISNTTAHIVNRTLAKSPADRYQSYDDFIHNLEFALEDLQAKGTTSQSRSRVVMETAEDHRSWTWVVLGMAAVAIILTVVFFVMQSKNRGPVATRKSASTSAAEGSTGAAGMSTLSGSLDALAGGKADAAERFRTGQADPSLSATDRAWAAFLEGIAETTLSRPAEAKKAFTKVDALAAQVKDPGTQKFLRDASAKLAKGDPISKADASSLNPRNHEAIGLLAYGLHEWAGGRIEDGAALLRQFRSAQPGSGYTWFNTLKPLATTYVADLARLEMFSEKLKLAATPAERADVAREFRQTPGALTARVEQILAPFAKEVSDYLAVANRPPTHGFYRIVNQRSGKIIDVVGFNRGGGALLNLYPHSGQCNQTWEIIPQPDGACELRAMLGPMFLDLADANQDEGGLVRMWDRNGSDAQRWKFELHGDGYFKIRAKASNKVLAVRDRSVDNGASIEQQSDISDPSQLWRIQRDGDAIGDGWASITVGAPQTANRAEFANGTFTIVNQGRDIWDRDDECTIVARAGTVDFDFSARLVSFSAADPWSKAGLMARNTLSADQPNVTVISSAEHGVSHQWRKDPGVETNWVSSDIAAAPAKSGFVRWLKLERRGNRFTSFSSVDGTTWTQIGSDEVGMFNEPIVGLVVSSHHRENVATAKFDHVTLVTR